MSGGQPCSIREMTRATVTGGRTAARACTTNGTGTNRSARGPDARSRLAARRGARAGRRSRPRLRAGRRATAARWPPSAPSASCPNTTSTSTTTRSSISAIERPRRDWWTWATTSAALTLSRGRARDLLDSHSLDASRRARRKSFHAGVSRSREIDHDSNLYATFRQELARLRKRYPVP